MIRLNGDVADISVTETIASLLARKKINPQMVVVEVNRRIVPRDDYAVIVLRDGDEVEIVKFIGGG